MSVLSSYRRLSKAQKIILGICGIVVGWYGPSVMSRLVLGSERAQDKHKPDQLR